VDFLLRGPTPPKDATVIKVNFSDNPWFPDVLRDEMEYDKRRDPDKYQHVWQGSYLTNSQSRVFKNWKIDDFEAPRDAIHRLGADWGFAVDPTVLVRCHIIGRTLYIDHEAYMVGCEIVNTPELFMQVPEAEKWPIVADSARPETISHMRKNGFPKIMTAVKGAKSVEEGIEFLKNYDIVVHPRCIHTIDELTLYSYRTDPLTGKILPLLQDKKNHVIDALRYAAKVSDVRISLRLSDFHSLASCQQMVRKSHKMRITWLESRTINALPNLHAEALRQFNDIQTALRDERLQCLQDRRFYSLAGAQWEGPLYDQYENKPRSR
jgi:phage terminase large subunit